MLRETDLAILKALTAEGRDRSPSLQEVATQLGVSSAFLSTRLTALAKDGWVRRSEERTSTGRTVHYQIASGLALQWVSADETIVLHWRLRGEVDWEFPLVSQVPDEAARLTIVAYLRELRRKGLLSPALHEPDGPDSSPVAVQHHGLTVVLYGSTARGSAKAGSDVDLLVFEGERQSARVHPMVENAAADVSLHTPRPVQVKVLKVDEVDRLPERIERAVKSDGIVVYDGLRTRSGGATLGIWQFVYGGRR